MGLAKIILIKVNHKKDIYRMIRLSHKGGIKKHSRVIRIDKDNKS